MSKLDHYLIYDHSARRTTTLIAVGVGAIVGGSAEALGTSFGVAVALCFVSVACIEIVRAFR